MFDLGTFAWEDSDFKVRERIPLSSGMGGMETVPSEPEEGCWGL